MGAVCHRKLLTMAVLLAVHLVAAKPGQLQEERREYQYQRSHRISSSNTMDGGGAGYYSSRSGNYQTQDSGMSEWAKSHQEQVQRMAEQMRSEYNAATTGAASMSSGGRSFSSSVAMANGNAEDCDKPTAFAYSFTGKSQAELDEMAKKMTHQIIEELQSGQLRQSQITQPKWFLHRAAEKMEERESGQHSTQQHTSYGSETEDLQQQQQQIFTQDEIRQSQGAGYGGYNYNRENYERTQERQQPPVVSGGHYSSSQSKKEEEERYRTYRPAPTPAYTTSHSQSSSSQQSSERRSQVVVPTPVSVVSEYNKQDSEYSRSQVQTPTAIPTHSGSYFSQSHHDRHRQYQRPRPLESASSTHYQSNVEEEEESRQRQVPIVLPSQHTYSASSSQINKETETVPVYPQTYNYGREHSAREESSYSKNSSYVVPTVSSSRHRQQHQSEVIVETITHKPIVNTGATHRIYDYKAETDLKVSPLYKPAYTEQSNHEKFEEEQMRIRQQQQRQPVVTVTSQKEQVESEVNRQRYRQPQPVIHTSMSAHEAEDTQQVQQVVFEQPTVESLHREELTEEEERRRIYNQRQPGYVHSSSQTDETEESRRTTQQRPSYGSSTSQYTVQETERTDSMYARPTYGGSTSQSGYNRTEESSSREHRPAPVVVGHYSASQKETKEESEYRRQQQPTQTIYTTTIEERNEEIRRRQQQQAEYERRYAASGYNRSESESSYSGGQYQSGVSSGHREYSLEERERQRTAGGGGGYYIQSGYSKEEEERRRLAYERRQHEAAAGSASTHETENVQISGLTAHQDQTSYTSSMGENDVQQKLIDVDAVVEEVTETGEKAAKTIISKDRGDQPPQTFEEDYESEEILEAEPGIGTYPIDKKPEPLLSSTTSNPYYSAPLAPYTSEQEKRRYQTTMSQQTQVVPTAAETEEYRRHYQRTHSSHQYTTGNLYPQQHAQQHELGNVLTEQTSDLNVSPLPPLDAASQTLHRQTSSSVVVGSSGSSNSVSTNYNTQQLDLAGSEQIRESAEAFDDDVQQRQVAVNFNGDATGGHNEHWEVSGSQGNGKYVETADQLEERRRKADEKNSTWNHESSYTFEVQKEIDGDDYADVQQQVQDMTKEFGEHMGQQREHEDLTQRQMEHYSRGESQRLQQHQQSSYSRGGAHQSSYGSLEAQEKVDVEEPAPEVTPEPAKETAGFWKRFRNRAKDIVG